MRYLFILMLIVSANSSVYSQKHNLVSGPVQGHITSTTAKLSLIVKKTKMVVVLLSNKTNAALNKTITINTDTIHIVGKEFPLVVEFTDLNPDTEYEL